MTSAIFYSPVFLKHQPPNYHPENPQRLETIINKLEKAQLTKKIAVVEPQAATKGQIALNHSKEYINQIEDFCLKDGGYLDPDTYASKDSFEAALLAAGSGIQAVDLIKEGKLKRAFLLVRPPGHHAEYDRAMGFCLFNNAAITASYGLDKGFKRILLLDWDAHHGNGTQSSFYQTDKVLYISFHQWPLYPGTGNYKEIGSGKAKGYTLNFALPPFSGNKTYQKIFEQIINPIAYRYQPDLVIISGGFDSHFKDPLAQLSLTIAGYKMMAENLKLLANQFSSERLIFVLEGGYNLETTGNCVLAILSTLAEIRDINTKNEEAGEKIDPGVLNKYRGFFSQIWGL